MANVFMTTFALMLGLVAIVDGTAAEPCQFDRQKFLGAQIDSMKSPPGFQHFTLGKLADGRTLDIQIEYSLTRNGSNFHLQSGNQLCIQIDRNDAARANMILDAFTQCRDYGPCEKLHEYIKSVFKMKTIADWRFIEEIDSSIKPKMKNWCLNQTKATRWSNDFTQYILAIQSHEIAHAVLHANLPDKIEPDREAEADGFAAALADITELELTAASMYWSINVEAERTREVVLSTHYLSECRTAPFFEGLANWYARNQDLSPPQGLRPKRSIAASELQEARIFMPSSAEICEKYNISFDRGVKKAFGLISRETTLNILEEEFGKTCSK